MLLGLTTIVDVRWIMMLQGKGEASEKDRCHVRQRKPLCAGEHSPALGGVSYHRAFVILVELVLLSAGGLEERGGGGLRSR